VSPHAWEESTGLLSSLATADVQQTDLKLGPAPLDDSLRQETERRIREQAMSGFDPELSSGTQFDLPFPYGVLPPGMVAPASSDLLPHPPHRTVDIQREVEKIRDARKRIKLDPSALSGDIEIHGFDKQSSAARAKALPSICAYTLHDAADG